LLPTGDNVGSLVDGFQQVYLHKLGPSQIFSRIAAKVVNLQLQDAVDEKLWQEQFGFKKGSGCAHMISMCRWLTEKNLEWGLPLYMCSLDLKKAFDRIARKALVEIICKLNLHPSLKKYLIKYYDGQSARIKEPGTDPSNKKLMHHDAPWQVLAVEREAWKGEREVFLESSLGSSFLDCDALLLLLLFNT